MAKLTASIEGLLASDIGYWILYRQSGQGKTGGASFVRLFVREGRWSVLRLEELWVHQDDSWVIRGRFLGDS